MRPGATAAHKTAVLPAEISSKHLHKHKSEHHIEVSDGQQGDATGTIE